MSTLKVKNGNGTRAQTQTHMPETQHVMPRQFLLDQHQISFQNIQAIVSNIRKAVCGRGHRKSMIDDFDEAMRIVSEDIPEKLLTFPEHITSQQELDQICKSTRKLIQDAKSLIPTNSTKVLQTAFTRELTRAHTEIARRFRLPEEALMEANEDTMIVDQSIAASSKDEDLAATETVTHEEDLSPSSLAEILQYWGYVNWLDQMEYMKEQLDCLIMNYYGDFLAVISSADATYKFGEKLSANQVRNFVQLAQDCYDDMARVLVDNAPDFEQLSEKLVAALEGRSHTYPSLPPSVIKEFKTWVVDAICARLQRCQNPESFVNLLIEQDKKKSHSAADMVREVLMEQKIFGEELPLQEAEEKLMTSELKEKMGRMSLRQWKKLCKDEARMGALAKQLNDRLHGGYPLRSDAFVAQALNVFSMRKQETHAREERQEKLEVHLQIPQARTTPSVPEVPDESKESEREAQSQVETVQGEQTVTDLATTDAAPPMPAEIHQMPTSSDLEQTAAEQPNESSDEWANESLRMRGLLLAEILAQKDNITPPEGVLQHIEGLQQEGFEKYEEYARQADRMDEKYRVSGKRQLNLLTTVRQDAQELRRSPDEKEKLMEMPFPELLELHEQFSMFRRLLDETEQVDALHTELTELCHRINTEIKNIEQQPMRAKPVQNILKALQGFGVNIQTLFGDALSMLQRSPEFDKQLQQLKIVSRELSDRISSREESRESTQGISQFLNEALSLDVTRGHWSGKSTKHTGTSLKRQRHMAKKGDLPV